MNVRLLCLGTVLVATACASASQTGDTPSRMDVISQADIAELSAATALDVVRRLRPGWLRVRTGGDQPISSWPKPP
jgi:outer membrane cobalamin receptor